MLGREGVIDGRNGSPQPSRGGPLRLRLGNSTTETTQTNSPNRPSQASRLEDVNDAERLPVIRRCAGWSATGRSTSITCGTRGGRRPPLLGRECKLRAPLVVNNCRRPEPAPRRPVSTQGELPIEVLDRFALLARMRGARELGETRRQQLHRRPVTRTGRKQCDHHPDPFGGDHEHVGKVEVVCRSQMIIPAYIRAARTFLYWSQKVRL